MNLFLFLSSYLFNRFYFGVNFVLGIIVNECWFHSWFYKNSSICCILILFNVSSSPKIIYLYTIYPSISNSYLFGIYIQGWLFFIQFSCIVTESSWSALSSFFLGLKAWALFGEFNSSLWIKFVYSGMLKLLKMGPTVLGFWAVRVIAFCCQCICLNVQLSSNWECFNINCCIIILLMTSHPFFVSSFNWLISLCIDWSIYHILSSWHWHIWDALLNMRPLNRFS